MSVESSQGDAELLAATRNGNAAAYGGLYERHAPAARALARQLVRSAAEAEDVVAETFTRILDLTRRGGGPKEAFRVHLLTAVRRTVYDRERRRTASGEVSEGEAELFDPGVPFVDPALIGLERSLVARAFLSLPERWQSLLWHVEVEKSGPADVAPLIGLPADQVAELLGRAKEGLRQACLKVHLSGTPRKGCRPSLSKMGAYVRGGLVKRETRLIDRHMDGCTDCRAVFMELTDVDRGLRVIVGPLIAGPVLDGYLTALGKAGRRVRARRAAAGQRAMTPDHTGETYQLDAALDVAAARLHRRVAAEVAEAVGLLARLSAVVDVPEPLRGYHDRFLDRYGVDVPVPVRELLDPATGLGPPTHDAGRGGSHGGGLSRYEQVLLETLAGACRDGAGEVELTDGLVRRLLGDRVSSAGDRLPMPSVDVYLQLAAADAGAVDRGEYLAVLNTHGLAPGGCTFGRFADLFTPEQQDRLADYIRHRERRAPHAAVAELAYLPTNGRAGNVAVRPRIHRYEIPVNVSPSAPPDDVIDLDDICVGASHDRFYLWSRRLGRELVIAESHMLSAAVAPDVARFLIEASQMRHRRITAFSWESLESGPYLPRVVRGKVVLRPAEWGLNEAPPGDGPFAERLDAWRRRWRVPRHVYLVDEDNRLLLDLEHPDCRAELGRGLAKGPVRLQEMLPGADDLWVRDTAGRPYVTEFVLPLTCEAPPDPPVPAEAVAAAARAPRQVARPRLLPGGAWSFAKLYADLERHDEIIAGPLRELAESLGPAADRWFYIRYTDPAPHLRVRFRAADGADPRAVLDRLLEWGRHQVERGLAADLAVAGYDPEVARYGGPAVHDAIERVFTAGSRSTAAILDLVWSGRLDLDRELLTVAVLDKLYEQWGLGPAERLAAVPAVEADEAALALYRPRRKFLADLLVPWDAHPEPLARSVHALLEPVLAEQAAAVSTAARAVRRAAAEGELWGTEHDILLSLAHMTVNRMAGTDRAGEERSYAIWKHVLKMIGGRPA
ncbi:thiopeptide-type bacteriocin biosynthesis protein [Planomonospora algeriensis]